MMILNSAIFVLIICQILFVPTFTISFHQFGLRQTSFVYYLRENDIVNNNVFHDAKNSDNRHNNQDFEIIQSDTKSESYNNADIRNDETEDNNEDDDDDDDENDDDNDSPSPSDDNDGSTVDITSTKLTSFIEKNDDEIKYQHNLKEQEHLNDVIMSIWNEYIENSTSSDIHNTSTLSAANVVSEHSHAFLLRANGTDISSFRRQLLAQFISPLMRGEQRALWLDPEFVLNIRGQFILATTPPSHSHEKLASHIIAAEQYNRGLKLVCPTGTSSIVKSIITALTQSVNGDLVIVNRRIIDSVRLKVHQQYNIDLKLLSAEKLMEVLFTQLHSLSPRRCVVCLQDEMSWFVHQYGIAKVLKTELQRTQSNVFLLSVDPEPPLTSGYSPSEARAKLQGPSVSSLTQDVNSGSGSPQFSFPFPSPGQFMPPPPMSSSSSNNANKQNPSSFSGRSQSSGQSPGQGLGKFSNTNNNNLLPPGSPVTMGQSFQITIKNGSASIAPIPSIVPQGALPPGYPFPPGMMPFPPGMMPFPPAGAGGSPEGRNMMPNPPEALMRKIVEHRQKKQREGVSEEELGLTEEDMRLFMSDPANRAAMQVCISCVIVLFSYSSYIYYLYCCYLSCRNFSIML